MKIINSTVLLTFFSICALTQPLWADQSPQALATDQRIRQVMYSPNEVYEITSTHGFQTVIEFSPQETITVASIGDSIAWQVMPAKDRVFIKPVGMDAVTNMTVVTDKRTYYFNLVALRSQALGELTYLVRFQYPNPGPIYEGLTESPKDPTKLNFNYKIKSAKKTGLTRVFDDGEFTYLQFRENIELPAIFSIQTDGKEALVNYRMQEPYVVIERVMPGLMLRRGKDRTKLTNQSYLQVQG